MTENQLKNINKKPTTIELVNKNLAKRHRAEIRFRAYGIAAILFGLACLVILFTDIISKGHSAFLQTYIYLEVNFDEDTLEISDPANAQQLAIADYQGIIKKSLRNKYSNIFQLWGLVLI